MKRGFTLVELSIVLVIIGLLIGGILVGQSLIQTAKNNSIIRQLQQFDIAVSNFKTKFKSLPGDSGIFGCASYEQGYRDYGFTCNNGIVGDDNVGEAFMGEISHFWPVLQQGGFAYKGKTFASDISNSLFDISSNSPNSPIIKADVDAAIVATFMVDSVDNNQPTNYFYISDWSTSGDVSSVVWGSSYSGNPVFKPANIASIDQKIDDGKPFVGNIVIGVSIYNSGVTLPYSSSCTDWSTNGNNTATARYLTSDNSVSCYLAIQMLSQVGQ